MPSDLKTGSLIIEGKTKKILEICGESDKVLMVSKDRITAGDGVKAHDMEGKSVISTATTAKIFEYLNEVGIKTHYIKQYDERSLIAKKCDMIPIEWVSRRHATGSFLRRNPGVTEGYRFCPLKLETFYKDDANHDPQWSDEQLICAELVVGGLKIGRSEVEIMHKTTACIFEVLEKAWASLGCSLIDMKVEYGVTTEGELVLADVIDSDSWRLWPSGDKRLMVDKQVYRNLTTVTQEDLEKVKRNFQWVAEKVKEFLPRPKSQVVILMGSPSDKGHCSKIREACDKFGIPSVLRVTSAHKGPDETLNIISQYEGHGQPTVFIAAAGRSNGLGPVTSGNSAFPVINCPPITADWGQEDIWSSLRLPSGLGCTTVLFPEGAAIAAAQIFALNDHVIWSRLKAKQLNTWISLKHADKNISA
ncbi:bifunctional phosphoribosylaminoimidazole carboxylase/phosphoribosylaminoimidazole succinocarboxamide synthetase-like [Uloborus diversus]|uniref:bifunctional phosphoribosylaminoimidazole carboxylase/phosphoribosylaminoimidazole succinocarboxamide synthetase-like n=1 Tax=Uloborus diversus TaxID=327109 RepID=UPI0024090976|nr:bifunctional phosphoribosylaminoimidazole carboxylase/phosphoribosylaminoimidazole succinocarboxamide synthetase-like [Uloborus diversus]